MVVIGGSEDIHDPNEASGPRLSIPEAQRSLGVRNFASVVLFPRVQTQTHNLTTRDRGTRVRDVGSVFNKREKYPRALLASLV